MTEILYQMINTVHYYLWGIPMLALILGTGLFLQLGLQFIPLRKLSYGFRWLLSASHGNAAGDIAPFKALMTSLSATIGTGNIAGVATAIAMGGPGALFWMWCTALVGMATKYSEALLAVHYRETDVQGEHHGGPMYYIKNGLGKRFYWLGFMFAFCASIAGFGIGNMVQANSMAAILQVNLHVPLWLTAVLTTFAAASVLLGGLQRVANVAARLVPCMAFIYVGACMWILLSHITLIPNTLSIILSSAFQPTAAVGGFAGATIVMAMRFGVARGVFSNEAGLGSAPIVHASAKTNSPVRQGCIAMLGTFIDTLVICTMTGLVIVMSGTWISGVNGVALSSLAMDTFIGYAGDAVITMGMVLFAFTTLLSWNFYGERCIEFLLGAKSVRYYRWLWIAVIPVGALTKLTLVWLLADTLNAMMAIPNIMALLLLSPVVFKLTKTFWNSQAIVTQGSEI